MCVRGRGSRAASLLGSGSPAPSLTLWPARDSGYLGQAEVPKSGSVFPWASPRPTQQGSINMRRSTVCNRSQLWAVLGSPWRKPLLSSLNSSAFK